MNIILLTKSGGKPVTRHLHYGVVAVLVGVFLIGGAGGLAYLGYRIGVNQDPRIEIGRWEREIAAQRAHLQEVQEKARADVEALAMRVGQLQGYVTRLDALGLKLVKMAKLDDGEFNFGEPPGLGGPASSEGMDEIQVPDIKATLSDLNEELAHKERQLSVLEHLILDRNLTAEVVPAGRPIVKGWLSSGWGMRNDPFEGGRQFHKGVDFAGRKGEPILAVAKGVVTFAGKRWGYGNMVEVNHGNGYSTRYAHNSELLVSEGQAVDKGEPIARMGTTGRSTGYHVHFEVLKDGKQINPSKFIASK